jgi:hypothetical protein
MNVREHLFLMLVKPATAFDALRPEGSDRLDATNLMDLMPDVAVTMAHGNQPLMDESLQKDSAATLSGGTPEVKAALRTVIVRFVANFPECP